MHLPLKDLIEKKKKVNAINCLIVYYGCKLKTFNAINCLIVNYGCKLKKHGMSNV